MAGTFDTLGSVRHQIRYRYWAGIGHPGQTFAELKDKMIEIGNQILEVDEPNQRILVAETSDHVWGCGVCLQEGQLIITDGEDELRAHYAELHPGIWE